VRDVSDGVHPCDLKRTRENAVNYEPELLHWIFEMTNACKKISKWCETMNQNQMISLPEKMLLQVKSGQDRTSSFFNEKYRTARNYGSGSHTLQDG
jgi:hypothetical protein